MGIHYLIELSGNGILVAVLYGLASLVLGILTGYIINKKYKNQVEELERDRVRLNSTVSSLESDLDESKKARSNAEGEISLLRNQVRDRESRIKETEGKLIISNKKYEELQAQKENVPEPNIEKEPDYTLIEPKLSKSTDEVISEIKKVDDVASSFLASPSITTKQVVESKKDKIKKDKLKAKKQDKKKDKVAKSAKNTKEVVSETTSAPILKRGRPKTSQTVKSSSINAATSTKSIKDTVVNAEVKSKAGRPAKSQVTEVSKPTKVSKPKVSKSVVSKVEKALGTAVPPATKKRGRPAKNNPTTTTLKSTNVSASKASDSKVTKTNTPKLTKSADVIATVVTKKRGRPAKKTSDKIVENVIKTVEPKRRGRPAKKNVESKVAAKPILQVEKKATTAKTTSKANKTISKTTKAKAEDTKLVVGTIAEKRRGRPTKAESKPAEIKTAAKTSPKAKIATAPKTRGRVSDNLKIIEGIGPKMEEALRNAGYKTFAKISKTSAVKLKNVLVKANTRFGIATTDTWPEQAALANNGEFDKLKILQDSLNRGK